MGIQSSAFGSIRLTVRELLRSTSLTLQQAGCNAPRLDAELLLAKAFECDHTWLIAHADDSVSSSVLKTHTALAERRRKREPLAYITGEKEFWSRPFFVTPDVLIPRPETEHLIEAILGHFQDMDAPYHFCDIGTGSGCIAVTLACEYPQTTVTATDISSEALKIAARNAERYYVSSRIEFHHGDMRMDLQGREASFDAIVSNPPYVAQHEMRTLEEELDFEPRHALTDEANGLTYLEHLIETSASWLKPDGRLIVETGTCGLPSPSPSMRLDRKIMDLAGRLRGGVFVCRQT